MRVRLLRPVDAPGPTGILLGRLAPHSCVDAVQQCLNWDHPTVASHASVQFDTHRIVDTILLALDAARRRPTCLRPSTQA